MYFWKNHVKHKYVLAWFADSKPGEPETSWQSRESEKKWGSYVNVSQMLLIVC